MASERDSEFDAVFVGSGINGLVGAALLAKQGWKVVVVEREDWLGGAIRTVTTPTGFETELMSCFHTQFMGSPSYRALKGDLERHGLRYANTDKPFAVVTDEGQSLIITTDHAANVAALEKLRPGEGQAWDAAIGTFYAQAGDLLGVRDLYPWSREGRRWLWKLYRRRGKAGALALLSELLMSARSWLDDTFEEPLIHALLAPWTLHGSAGPDEPGSATIVRAIAAFSEGMGCPVPVGGGRALVGALVGIIEEHGGTCRTGVDVERVLTHRDKASGVATTDGEITAKRAVICSVTPSQLYGRLLENVDIPEEHRAHAAHVRPGLANMQMAYSLDRKIDWAVDKHLGEVAVINLTGSLDAVSKAANEARRGLLPADPTICVGQPMAVDPSRGPEGSSQLWIQLLDLPAYPVGDAAGKIEVTDGWSEAVREAFADRVQTRLARQLPQLGKSVIERIAISPADLEAANINLVGGSSTSGAQELDQMLLLRPSPYATAPETPVEHLFHIGASTHPGASLAAVSGFLIAERLARPRFPRLRRQP